MTKLATDPHPPLSAYMNPGRGPAAQRWRLGAAAFAVLLLTATGCGDTTDPSGGPDAGPGGADAAVEEPEPDAGDVECPLGHAGADCTECDDEYQDDDEDGVCKPSCEATGSIALNCGDHGTCQVDGDTGDRICECAEGHKGFDCTECVPGYVTSAEGCVLYTPSAQNLVLWLDATSGVTVRVGTTVVTSWKDRRGGQDALSLTGSSDGVRPSRIVDAMNGRPVVRFDGNDNITLSDLPGLKGADYTIIVVFRPFNTSAHPILRTAQLENGTTVRLDRSANGTYRYLHNAPLVGGSGDVITASFASASTPKLLVARRWTSTILKVHQLMGNDGTQLTGISEVTTATEPNLGNSHTLHVGDSGLVGDLAEVLIYDRVLETAEMNEISTYLNAKWAIQ